MNIVHVIPSMARGGAERVVTLLANEQVRRGESVTVLVAHDAETASFVPHLDPRVSYKVLFAPNKCSLYYYVAAARKSWLRDATISGADVIHCHLTFGAFVGSMIQLRRKLRSLSKPAVVETYHAVSGEKSVLRRYAHATQVRKRDAFALMALDTYWQTFLSVHRARGRFIPNGVSLPASTSSDSVAGHAKEGRRVGTLGRISRDRRPLTYIPIFESMKQQQTTFVIGGDGQMMPELERQREASAIRDRVRLVGFVNSPQTILHELDVFVTIVVRDIVGLAGLEAISGGVPVVGIQVDPRFPYEREVGWIPQASTPEQVAALIDGLLINEPARQELASRQYAVLVESLTDVAMADAYNDLYHRALAPQRS